MVLGVDLARLLLDHCVKSSLFVLFAKYGQFKLSKASWFQFGWLTTIVPQEGGMTEPANIIRRYNS